MTYDQVLQWSINAIAMIAFLANEADEGCYFDQLTTSSPQVTNEAVCAMIFSWRYINYSGDSVFVNDNSDSFKMYNDFEQW